MIVTIHQPEHFPYMGYFEKMKNADVFVILDNVKFKKNNWQNRNKFINKQGNEEWFGVSIPKKSNSLLIKDVVPVNEKINNWKQKVVKKLIYNFGKDFSEIYNETRLIDINMASIYWARSQLGIDNKIVFASDLKATGKKSELLANICKELNATEYISGPSGRDYLNIDLFENIKVSFFKPEVENFYSCVYNILK